MKGADMETEEIIRRLLQLEARCEVQNQHLLAQRTIHHELLKLLHTNGVIPLPELVAAAQSFGAFAQGAFGKPKDQILEVEIHCLQQIADALPRSGQ
jgi:hypothetical protein